LLQASASDGWEPHGFRLVSEAVMNSRSGMIAAVEAAAGVRQRRCSTRWSNAH
jgi:hypothetical protein